MKSIQLIAAASFMLMGATDAKADGQLTNPADVLQVEATLMPNVVSDGAYRYQVDIEVPEYKGLQPNLAFSYNSANTGVGSPTALMGPGWNLSGFSFIRRRAAGGGIPVFDGARDVYNLDGVDLLACSFGNNQSTFNGTYPDDYRTSQSSASCKAGGNMAALVEDYQKIQRVNRTHQGLSVYNFIVTTPDGMRRTYVPSGVLNNKTPSNFTYAEQNVLFRSTYLLSEVRDTQFISNTTGNLENVAKYSYWLQGDSHGASPRLKSIDYGQGYRVDFAYENTGSAIATFALGGDTEWIGRQFHRLVSVTVRDGSQKIRAYEVTYNQSSDLDRKYVANIRQFGSDYTISSGDISGPALPGHDFTVTNDQAYFNRTTYSTAAHPNASFHNRSMIADFDLDGKDEAAFFAYDYTRHRRDKDDLTLTLPRTYYNFSNTQTATSASNWAIPQNFPSTSVTIPQSGTSSSSSSNLGLIVGYSAELDGVAVPTDSYILHSSQAFSSGNLAANTLSLKKLTNSSSSSYEWTLNKSPHTACRDGDDNFGPILGNFVPEVGDIPRKELFLWNNLYRVTPTGLVSLDNIEGNLSTYCQEVGSGDDEFPFEFAVDMNGDGVDEIIAGDYVFRYQNGSFVRHLLDNSPVKNVSLSRNVTFGDVNGDGAADAIIHIRNGSSGQLKVALSTGNDFKVEQNWMDDDSDVLGNKNTNTKYARNMSADINRDGLADIILHNGYDTASSEHNEYGALNGRIYLSTGTGFVRHTRVSSSNSSDAHFPDFQGIGDFDGDGDLDIVAGSHGYRNGGRQSRVYWQDAEKPFQITKVKTPSGGEIHVTYGPSRYGSDNKVPGVQQVVTSLKLTGLEGADRETTFAYEGSRYNYSFRRSIGFGKITETLPQLANETQNVTRVREFGQGMANSGRVLLEEELLGSTVYRQTENVYANRHLSAGLPFRSQLTRTTRGERSGGSLVSTRTDFVTNDYGQLTQKIERGFDGGRDDRATGYLYYPNASNYIMNRLAKTAVFRGLNASFNDTNLTNREYGEFFYYDGASNYNVAPIRGNVTGKLVWTGGGNNSTRLLQTLEYDSYGNVFKTTDARGFITRTTFDAQKRFPLSVTNAEGHLSSMTWNPGCQVPVTTTDANNLLTQLYYDRYCRETRRIEPTGQDYRTWYLSFGNVAGQYIKQRARSASTDTDSLYTIKHSYFDGFGQTYKVAEVGSTSDITDMNVSLTKFDERGNVARTSIPLSWAEGLTGNLTIAQSTRFSYDRLGRMTEIVKANQEKSLLTYSSWLHEGLDGQTSRWPGVLTQDGHCFDAANKNTLCGLSRQYFDADGNVIRSIRVDSNSTDVGSGGTFRNTYFDYDILGQLLRVKDPRGIEFTYTYDKYGNRITSDDPGLGYWTMLYDTAGNLTRQTDSADRKISFTYDGLNRPLTKRVNGVGIATSDIAYTYDDTTLGNYNVGKLSTETVDGLHTVLSRYHKNGQPDWVRHILDGRQYTTQFSYILTGDLLDQRLPKNPGSTTPYWVGQNTYDAANRNTGFGTDITSIDYDKWGNQTEINLPAGVRIEQEFDTRRGWMFRNRVYDAAGTRLDLSQYTRSIAGRVERQTDQKPEGRFDYTYDYAGRLLSAITAGNRPLMNQTFTYDAAGSMRSNSKVGAYTYGPYRQRPYIVNGEDIYYDVNGNMTQGLGGKLMEYDGENRPLSVTYQGERTEYRYGAGGERVMKIENVGTADETTTAYIGNVEIRNFKQGAAEEVITYPHPNVRLVNGVSSYLNRDQLGSVRTIINDAGELAKTSTYRPFGEALEFTSDVTEPIETKGWIGERFDAGAGLQYLNARYYDPELGLFLQPDWFDVTEPGVGTNRYSYSFNDPINLSDPSGNGIFGKPLRELGAWAIRRDVAAARSRGVADAWKMERQLVREIGRGTVDWTRTQMDELLDNGKVKGFVGDHRNTVNGNLEQAADHKNIQFLPTDEHVLRHAGMGGTQVPISGLSPIDRTLDGLLPDLATKGARQWSGRVLGATGSFLGTGADILDAFDPIEIGAGLMGYEDSFEMIFDYQGESWQERQDQACASDPDCT